MSLFKRGNVLWVYFYRNGIRYQYSTGTGNRKKAEKIEAKRKEELNDERFQVAEFDPNVTFEELAARFVASASVRPHHLYHLQFLLPFFGESAALRITKSMAQEFRRARKAHNPLIKDATINRDLSVLRHILYWSVDEQLIPVNPLTRFKMERERRTRRKVLSVAEERRLLPVAADHLRRMIVLALDTGMRRSEITTQRWEDIDFAQEVLFVTRSKTPEGEAREIPMTRRLLKLLLQDRKPEGLVITYEDGPVRIVKRAWKTAVRNAAIRPLRFHDLRHTFNTRLMEAHVMREVRMALMGHSTGSDVHSEYTHVELPVKRKAIRRLERWKIHQKELLMKHHRKEQLNAHSETERSESTASAAVGDHARAQALEEENSRGSGPGASREAQGGDSRNGRRVENQTQTASKIRRSQKAV